MTTIAPAIVLVRPQMGENIGAAARAMANFGLSDLRLVAPRDGWPNPKASDMAGRALDLVDNAALHANTADAVRNCQFVLATTARERSMNLPVMEARAAVRELHSRAAQGERTAILFGPERTGLENADIMQAHAVVSIPVAPEYTSLNLAQAVVVIAYEWHMAAGASPALANGDAPSPRATGAEFAGLAAQLESALDAAEFWRVAEKKEAMWRNIRATLIRAGLTAQEVATWRGIVRALTRR